MGLANEVCGDKVQYVELNDIFDLRLGLGDEDEIDLTSGSMAHAFALAEHATLQSKCFFFNTNPI